MKQRRNRASGSTNIERNVIFFFLTKKKKKETVCLRYAERSKKNKDYSKVMVPGGRRDGEVVNGDRREAEERDQGER